MKKILLPLLFLLSGCVAANHKSAKNFQELKFSIIDGKKFEAMMGIYRVRLFNPDNQSNPTMWEGPLEIFNSVTKKSCLAENIPLVTSIYSSPDADHLLIDGFSGSTSYLQGILFETCQEKWPQLEVLTEGISIQDNILTIQPGCECAEPPTPCQCSAGQVLQLSPIGAPIRLRKKSLDLTKRILGVEFEGVKQVLNPKTPEAKVVD